MRGRPSRGCGDSSAGRKFPSDKVYRRDDRGIVGVESFGPQGLGFVVIHTELDVGRRRTVRASPLRRVSCFHLDVSADHLRFLTDLTHCGLHEPKVAR